MTGLWTTTVGSFAKPAYLQAARNAYAARKVSKAEVDRLTLRATREVMELQNDLGLDILVDGEMERGDMVAYFAERLPGMKKGGLVRSYGNRYYHKPVIAGELGWQEPVTVALWRYAQGLTDRPVKGMLTGPYTMVEWSFDEYYGDRRAAVLAMAEVVRQEALALESAGAAFIQIDEPACSTRAADLPLVLAANQIVTRDLKPATQTISHICYGDFAPAYSELTKMPVDQLDLEMANSNYALLELMQEGPPDKDIGLGVLDVHTRRIESVDEVVAGLKRALHIFSPDRLYIDPDCGLKTRTWDESAAKIRVMVEAVSIVRTEYGIEC